MSASVHDALGARWVETGSGVRMIRNYGDPAAEYAAARNDVVIAARFDRTHIRVHGRDPVKMVQGLISNDIANTPESRAVYAAVLTPKGKMVADVRVLKRGAELLLEVDAGARDNLVAHLKKFVPPLFARFETTEQWVSFTVAGPRAAECVTRVLGTDAAALVQEDDAHVTTFEDAATVVIASATLDVPSFDIIVDAAFADSLWEAFRASGAHVAGHGTLEVLRVEAGRPRWGYELDESTIPLEANLRARAISETKGCYTGQEVIIRILHRGHVNRHLRRVLLGDVAKPGKGTALLSAEGKQLGTITSAVWSPKYGQVIALAYVRREVVPPAVLRLGSAGGSEVTVRSD